MEVGVRPQSALADISDLLLTRINFMYKLSVFYLHETHHTKCRKFLEPPMLSPGLQ